MRRCLGAFFQVGGVKSLESVLRDMDSLGVLELWARAPALRYLNARGFSASLITAEKIRKSELGQYDMVLTDTINMARSADGPLIGRLWDAAASTSTPSLAFVDSWWGYGNRFIDPDGGGRIIHPTVIAVVDETARQGMIDTGHSPESLKILGSPHLDSLREERKNSDGRAQIFRTENGLEKDFVCLFVSQPLESALPGGAGDWGFNELTTLAAIGAQAARLPDEIRHRFQLLVLPHPEDDVAALAQVAAKLPMSCRVLENSDPLDAVCGADLVCGMFSILLTEAVLLGRVVLSVQLGLKKEDMLVTNMVGATHCARTDLEFAEMFEGLVCDPVYRASALAAQERFTVVGDSRTRWSDQLKYMRTERR